MSKMRVIVVGGFLGAGKTTLLSQAAKHFAAQGKSVGIITNDQAAHLVDTQLLSGSGVAVREIAGGCFCCRFEDFERTADRLFKDMRPDVILSEPVGSCMDISATVLQPMKHQWGEWAEVSPFSVLVDPRRLRQILDGENSNLPDSVRYIIKKQWEEADYLVINKIDLLSQEELAVLKKEIESAEGTPKVFEISALKDHGVTEWLDAVLGGGLGGKKILDVNYDTYADGEAELGWLNASISLTARDDADWNSFAWELVRRIHHELKTRSAEIGHLKLVLSHSAGEIVANATSIAGSPETRGSIGTRSGTVALVINARAHLDPQELRSVVERSIFAVAGEGIEPSQISLQSFKPAYPRPTHRFDRIVV